MCCARGEGSRPSGDAYVCRVEFPSQVPLLLVWDVLAVGYFGVQFPVRCVNLESPTGELGEGSNEMKGRTRF